MGRHLLEVSALSNADTQMLLNALSLLEKIRFMSRKIRFNFGFEVKITSTKKYYSTNLDGNREATNLQNNTHV